MSFKTTALQALGLVAAFSTAVTTGGGAEAQTKVYPCAGSNSYDQPNSYYAKRVSTFGSSFDVDVISKTTDAKGVRWIQVKWHNGFPGQTGAGWKFGWIRAKDICK